MFILIEKSHIFSTFSQVIFRFQTIDEESLKQLNDEQLFRLLEEAYHSKKLDEKNKSAIFKVRILSHRWRHVCETLNASQRHLCL